ncbi:hypothetical protein DV737_g3378, partial [Chaetothyriales sp. CBS 132003]
MSTNESTANKPLPELHRPNKDVPALAKSHTANINANIHYPFWFGGSAAAMAAVVTHPLDLIKVRLQTRAPNAPNSTLGTFAYIVKNEGPIGLYGGLTAALLRQLTYSTVRFGVYEELKVKFAPAVDPDKPRKKTQAPLSQLILMSSVSGFLGGIAGNTGDVLNVRMQSDKSLPPEHRRNYRNAIHGLIRMVREEGASSLFRGVEANSIRALLMTASQLASYDAFKHMFLSDTFNMKDNTATHFLSSFLAGFVATTVCSPVDVIKTRIMSAESKTGIMEILLKAQRQEGLLWIFKGWVPSFIRLGPQTICTMIFLEQHKKYYRKLRGLHD